VLVNPLFYVLYEITNSCVLFGGFPFLVDIYIYMYIFFVALCSLPILGPHFGDWPPSFGAIFLDVCAGSGASPIFFTAGFELHFRLHFPGARLMEAVEHFGKIEAPALCVVEVGMAEVLVSGALLCDRIPCWWKMCGTGVSLGCTYLSRPRFEAGENNCLIVQIARHSFL
jgi:hypothetical protein